MARKTLLCSRCHYSKLPRNNDKHCYGTGAPYELTQAHQDAFARATREKKKSRDGGAFLWYTRLYYQFMSKCISGQLNWSDAEKREALDEYNRRYDNAGRR